MNKTQLLTSVLVACLFFTTGCWDRVELNDRAILLGWGMDIMEDGKYEAAAEIAIPNELTTGASGGGSKGKGYFVVSATGKDITDAADAMQLKLSRHIFPSHRRAIFLGERLAKHGLSKALDEYTRNPGVRMRTDIFVLKGGDVAEALKTPYPFERIPALAAIKMHEAMGGRSDLALRDFLITASTEGACPTMPIIESAVSSSSNSSSGSDSSGSGGSEQTQSSEPSQDIVGTAIFDKTLKMVGELNAEETLNRLWLMGVLKHKTITAWVPEGQGYVTYALVHLSGKVVPTFQKNRWNVNVTMSGIGDIFENETTLDLTKAKYATVLQDALAKKTQDDVTRMIARVQKEYGTDIFGIGEAIHRKYPNRWRTLKTHWDTEFKNTDVTVNVKLTIRRFGLEGPAADLEPTEVKQ